MKQAINPSLDGRVALVTGASRGIGRAIAQRFAAAGAEVVVSARSLDRPAASRRGEKDIFNPGTLRETVDLIESHGGRAIALSCDLENAEQRGNLISATVKAAGRLDILVNNAGFARNEMVDSMTDDTFLATLDHYFVAPFVLSRAAIPIMKRQGGGWILNLGSVAAYPPLRPYHPMEAKSGYTVYGAVKAALARLTQGLAMELQDDNIAVNSVAPSGAIATPGASAVIPPDYPTEPIEVIASVALDLVHAPARERSGLTAYSMHYAEHYGLTITSLDGREILPPAKTPAWSHPGVTASGL